MIRSTLTNTILLFLFTATSLNAQTIFKYGNKEVSQKEFLRAYNKNSSGEKADEKSYREYLDLYIRFKLKVQDAFDKGMDTLPGQQAELQSFRSQVLHNFMEDDSTVDRLLREAFERSQKDIHIAHIFIPYNTATLEDTAKANKLAQDAWKQLQKGMPFGNIARLYSADTAAWEKQGDIGYITVFTLPYELENLAYNTPPGTFSKPYTSSIGIHIFKNLGERKAVGSMKAAQILLAFPPDANESTRMQTRLKADSIYNALQKGSRFEDMAAQFSNDNLSYLMGGELAPFGVGTYDLEFENAAFSLNKNGAISKPILTKQGYHIIKRLEVFPVNTDPDSAEAMTDLKFKLKNDLRMNETGKALVNKAYLLTNLDKEKYSDIEVLNFYREHLEEYNPEFAAQLNEFKEGNLLFEIMQATIWEKAANDSVGLKEYYQLHKSKYVWDTSADAIIFTCNDSSNAEAIRAAFSINTSGWKDIVKANEGKVLADSGRFELTQLPVKTITTLQSGIITQPHNNETDHTSSFVYIVKIYATQTPRSFEEAKGFVLNDYQLALEDEWVKELKKKYPVVIDEEVFKKLLN